MPEISPADMPAHLAAYARDFAQGYCQTPTQELVTEWFLAALTPTGYAAGRWAWLGHTPATAAPLIADGQTPSKLAVRLGRAADAAAEGQH